MQRRPLTDTDQADTPATSLALLPAPTEPERGVRLPTVVIADDHAGYREGLARSLAEQGFDVIGEAADGPFALALIQDLQPDIALVDVRMPGLDGIEVLQWLELQRCEVPVVLLSAFSEPEIVAAAHRAGAAGFIDKTAGRGAISGRLSAVVRARRPAA
ncbi:MAG: response regulator transcription factor [Solirubrobacteraceae bacterium]|nr:response regulator transcription factor [Patulibacter sp.]